VQRDIGAHHTHTEGPKHKADIKRLTRWDVRVIIVKWPNGDMNSRTADPGTKVKTWIVSSKGMVKCQEVERCHEQRH
jgi:hypothetical protein